MTSDLVPVSFNKIMQSQAYTAVILATEKKRFAIYMDPQVGRNIQFYLTDEHKPRPFTHDLIKSIFLGLNVKLLQVVINDVEDTIYFSRLFLEQEIGEEKHVLEIDARPSDCITLALMYNAPVYCKKGVLEKTVAVEE